MSGSPFRFVRLVLIALAVWGGYAALEPYGLAWAVLPGALALIAAYALWRWLGLRRTRREQAREERWSQALIEPAERAEVLSELRAARAAQSDSEAHLRYSLLLADLLDVSGEGAEARALLEEIDVGALDPIEGAMVRHARASLELRAGAAAAARALLEPRAPRCGSSGLDMRLELLDALVDCEQGHAEAAREAALGVQRAAGSDEGLILEARIVRAAALDACGEREEALAAIRALGPEVLPALEALGSPRLRALAAATKKGS